MFWVVLGIILVFYAYESSSSSGGVFRRNDDFEDLFDLTEYEDYDV